MTSPDTDDLILFGALALAAVGAALVVVASTSDSLAAVGTALLVFGIPTFLIAFMAAGETEQ